MKPKDPPPTFQLTRLRYRDRGWAANGPDDMRRPYAKRQAAELKAAEIDVAGIPDELIDQFHRGWSEEGRRKRIKELFDLLLGSTGTITERRTWADELEQLTDDFKQSGNIGGRPWKKDHKMSAAERARDYRARKRKRKQRIARRDEGE